MTLLNAKRLKAAWKISKSKHDKDKKNKKKKNMFSDFNCIFFLNCLCVLFKMQCKFVSLSIIWNDVAECFWLCLLFFKQLPIKCFC